MQMVVRVCVAKQLQEVQKFLASLVVTQVVQSVRVSRYRFVRRMVQVILTNGQRAQQPAVLPSTPLARIALPSPMRVVVPMYVVEL